MRNILLAAAALLAVTLACGGGGGPPSRPPEGTLAALNEGGLVVLLDDATGQTVGELGLGYQPWALFRPSAGELLVSDLIGDQSQGRLFVYDLADLGEPLWEMEMPERASPIVYGPAWGLSADERYLYYTVHPRDERGQPQRLANVVAVVDLEERREVARAELPAYCPTMSPQGEQDILAVCSNRLVSITPEGAVFLLVSPPLRLSPGGDQAGFWHNAVLGGVHDGEGYLAFGNGEVLFSGDEEPAADLTAADERLWGGVVVGGQWQLDGGRALLAVGPPYPDSATGILFDRLLVFDPAEPGSPEGYDLPDGVSHAAPLDSRFVALMRLESATIAVLDLDSGDIVREFPAPAGVRWLVGR